MKEVLSLLMLAGAFAADKVNVTLYSESLCPDCIHFITGAWINVWNTPGVGGPDGIIDWNQVVFGNAEIQPDNTTIVCQHGAEECLMNTLQSCAVHQYAGNVSAWLPFIHCLETKGSNQQKYAQKCAQSNGLDWPKLDACWTGAEGHELDLENGALTSALQPTHQFVPWVTLGGQGSGTFCVDSNCDNFLQAVCDAYTGTKPAACSAA